MACVSNLGVDVSKMDYKVVNIIACYKRTTAVDLEGLSQSCKLEYFPELFPAVRYRDEDYRVTVNIFRTGNCVILGAKDFRIVEQITKRVKCMLENAEGHGRPTVSVPTRVSH